MLVYVVTEVHEDGERTQTYEGFCSCSPMHGNFERKPPTARFIALVQDEDTIDTWWIENAGPALDELKRMYRMEHGGVEPIMRVLVEREQGESFVDGEDPRS